MSALVDIWSNELVKSNGSSPSAIESSQSQSQSQSQVVPSHEKKSSIEVARAFVSRVMRIKPPVVMCSEGSVSMLVQCFSP